MPADDQSTFHSIKFLHWNVLAHRLCEGFDLVDDNACMLGFGNRLRLMEQHLQSVDADIVGLSEVDALSGDSPDAFLALREMVSALGYECLAEEKSNGISASAVLWKKNKFECIKSKYMAYAPGESQFLMYCSFYIKGSHEWHGDAERNVDFVFGETHLKAKSTNMQTRVRQCTKITEVFQKYQETRRANGYFDVPVIIAGDFNEEPQNEPIAEVMIKDFTDLYTLNHQRQKAS